MRTEGVGRFGVGTTKGGRTHDVTGAQLKNGQYCSFSILRRPVSAWQETTFHLENSSAAAKKCSAPAKVIFQNLGLEFGTSAGARRAIRKLHFSNAGDSWAMNQCFPRSKELDFPEVF